MALEGDLALFRLPDVLQVIAQQQKTGILTIQGKSDILAVSFLDGRIVAADALNQSFDELLGEVLASRGEVRPDDFARLLQEQRAAGERLADFLVDRSAVTRSQLLESLRDLTYRLLVEVLRWEEGQFKFYGGEEVAFEEGIRPLRVDEVLMQSMRDLAGETGRDAVVPRGFLAYARLEDGRPTELIPAGLDDTVSLDPAVAWITADEQVVLDRLDGRTPAETLAREIGFGEARTYYALYRLLQAGLVRPVGDSEAAPQPAPARSPAAPSEQPERPERLERPAPQPAWQALAIDRALVEEEVAVPVPHPIVDWIGRQLPVLCLLLAVLLVVAATITPTAVIFPAPGFSQQRQGLDRLRRLSLFARIDRAARTFHLLEGTYPSVLDELVSSHLLPRRDTRDPYGAPLAYRSSPEQYELQPIEGGQTVPSLGLKEGVFGDFLLDHSMFAGLEKETGVPIVLID